MIGDGMGDGAFRFLRGWVGLWLVVVVEILAGKSLQIDYVLIPS